MTSSLNYIYGVAVTQLDFIKWVVSHPASSWYKTMLVNGDVEDIKNLKEYCADMKKKPEEAEETYALEFLANVTENLHIIEKKETMKSFSNLEEHSRAVRSELHRFGAYEMAPDQCEKLGEGNWIVIGQRRVFINTCIKETVDPCTQLPGFLVPSPEDYNLQADLEIEMMKLKGLASAKECKYYLMQNKSFK